MARSGRQSLGDLASATQAQIFTGRQAEVGRLLGLLEGPLPAILFVHGQAGIGKTAYLHACRRACLLAGAHMEIVDSREFRHDTEALTMHVKQRVGGWPPGTQRPVVLAIDNFEELDHMVADFIDGFLALVSGPVLVVLAGRRPPVQLRAAPIGRFMTELALGPLPDDRAASLLAGYGVGDPDRQRQAVRLCGGSPLLLNLLGAAARATGLPGLADGTLGAEISSQVVARVAAEAAGSGLRPALEAAAQVRSFDQDLLGALTGEPAEEQFAALGRLSFIHPAVRGAALHDSVRSAVADELAWRRPAWARELRRRAYRHLRAEAAHDSGSDVLAEELLFLASSNLLQSTLFAGGSQVSISQATEADWPVICELVQARASTRKLRTPLAVQMGEAEEDFTLARAGFRLAANSEGVPVAYYNYLPLNAVTTKALGQRLRPWLRYLSAAHIAELRRAPATGRPPAVIVDSVCCRPGHESLVGALIRDSFLQFRRLEPGCVLTIAWAHGATAAIAEQMRWEALGPFGDQTAPGQPPITLYIQRDWAAGFDSYIERLLGLHPDPAGIDAVPAAQLHDAVKTALENLYNRTELRHSPLTQLRALQSAADPPVALRDMLIQAIRELENSPSGQHREAAALLHDIYIRRLASHEIVAQRLGLPRTTYYRRLRQGIQALATWLGAHDTSGPPP